MCYWVKILIFFPGGNIYKVRMDSEIDSFDVKLSEFRIIDELDKIDLTANNITMQSDLIEELGECEEITQPVNNNNSKKQQSISSDSDKDKTKEIVAEE